MKKVLSVILSGAMITSILAGCGGKSSSTQNATVAPASTVTSSVPSYMNATGLPITKEKVVYKAMGLKNPIQNDWKDMIVVNKLEQMTNVSFEWDTPLQSGYLEKKNLTLASGDVPDAFIGGDLKVNDEETYGPQGLLIPLEGLIDKYAPTLKKLLASDSNVKRAITSADGHIYALPYIVRTKTAAPADAITYINMKWLNNVGMQKPTTVDEFFNVLKAFKEKDPNKNGNADEIPYATIKTATPLATHYNSSILNAFTGMAGGANFDLNNGKVVYTPSLPAYKEFLIYMNKLYTNGLMDKESFTQTLQQLTAKGKAKTLGTLTSSPSTLLDVKDHDPYELLDPLTSSLNSKKVTPELPGINTGALAITKKCKNPEALLRWVDILYRDFQDEIDGISGLALFLGEHKVNWDFTDSTNTKYTRTSKDPQLSPVEYIQKMVTPGAATGWPGKVVTDAVPDGDEFLLLKANETIKHYYPYTVPVYPLYVRFTKAENDRAAILENDIKTYVNQFSAKVIIGEQSINDWDTYISTLKKMNLDELTKIKQDGYDRWNKVK